MRIATVILIMIVMLPGLNSRAQVNCMNTLKEAKELYEQGLIEDIPKMLSGCMESGFTRAQRIEAYKLIIMAYLFDDNQFEAEKIMDDFLKKFPEYEIMPNDPVEFTYLLESYKTSSVYSINLYFGPNFSNPRIIESFSVMDKNNTESDNKFVRGFQVGIGGSRNLVKGLNINLDGFYSFHNFSKTETTKSPIQSATSPMVTIYSKENLKKIDIPLSLTYTVGKGNLSYFGRLGFMYSFITQSKLTVERTHPNLPTISGTIDIKNMRPNYYIAVLAGAGMQYKVPRGYLVLDLRYHYGFNEMSTTENDFSNTDLWSNYYYSDDKFKLDFLTVNIGYYFTIYRSNRNKN
jgi:hypothetical protein